ncbi:MAG: dehydrogenase [Candidatus Hydrogenedentota bacterium]
MSQVSRRTFMHSAAAVSAGLLAASRAKAAPSDTLRHAIIGTGGQGRHHAIAQATFPDVEVVAIADVDPERRARCLKELAEVGNKAKEVEDFRAIIDDPEIDSVGIATPDHWHTPVALMALKAGKHVYVEKPCCHNIHEGIALRDAARKTGLCVQHGTQSRSGQGIKDAVQFMREGGIGKVRMAKAINHQFREAIGRAPVSEPPAGVNYDLWTGPGPLKPFTENRWHYNWHWLWDFGTGDMGNDGVHQIDVARWGLGAGVPKFVSASGGQLFYDDDHETPDTQVVTFEFEDCYLLYEMRLWTNYKMEGHDNGVVFYGDKGTVDVGRDGSFVRLIGEEPRKIGGSHDFTANQRNFADAVKAGDPKLLNAPIEEGVLSTQLVHLGNIATRVSERLTVAGDDYTFANCEAANALRKREYRTGYELPVV